MNGNRLARMVQKEGAVGVLQLQLRHWAAMMDHDGLLFRDINLNSISISSISGMTFLEFCSCQPKPRGNRVRFPTFVS